MVSGVGMHPPAHLQMYYVLKQYTVVYYPKNIIKAIIYAVPFQLLTLIYILEKLVLNYIPQSEVRKIQVFF